MISDDLDDTEDCREQRGVPLPVWTLAGLALVLLYILALAVLRPTA